MKELSLNLSQSSQRRRLFTCNDLPGIWGLFGGLSSGYSVSGGLHGVGLSVVNALSEALEVIVWCDGKEYQQKYSRGKPVTTLLCHELPDELKDRQGTHIKFWPDKEVAQYVVLKEECHQLFPIVGSGRFITAPVITEDGDPIQDPIVLLEANPDKGLATVSQENGIDVVRTDRTLVFYEKQENLSKLWDIHAVYAWFDIDVGYCQVDLNQ
ncbi:unnamed protein product [Camellia sinensis]